MVLMKSHLLISVVALLGFLGDRAWSDDQVVRQLIQSHCVACHGAEVQEGGLRLDSRSADLADPDVFAVWVKIHDRLRDGQMPPKQSPQPSADERRAALERLATQLTAADVARRQAEGRAVLRRLNRTEYENTLRDLFNLSGLSVKELLPEDSRPFGFDKSGIGLDLSYVQMSKYMDVADVALDAAIAPMAERPTQFKFHMPGAGSQTLFAHLGLGHTVLLKDFKYDDTVMPVLTDSIRKDDDFNKLKKKNLKHPYNGTIGVLVPEGAGEFKPRFPFRVSYPGKYKIRMSLWSFVWDEGEVKPSPRTESAILVAEGGRTLGYFDAPSLKPTVTEIEVWLNPMKDLKDELLFNAVSLKAGGGPISGRLHKYVGPGIALDWLEIEGPLLDHWPTAAHQRLFGELTFTPLPEMPKQRGVKKSRTSEPAGGDIHNPRRPPDSDYRLAAHGKEFIENLHEVPKSVEYATVVSASPEADAQRLLADFLPRAFRRPVTADEVARYVELAKSRLAEGDMFEVAMRTAYQAALCAPEFLFLKEQPGALDDWGLASRLSYFLWNSMPDDELFALAKQGRLHDQAVLRRQVDRMLDDPKADRFITDFTDQWLDLKDIDDTTPDRKLYPEFRLNLRDAMRAETPAFFRELVAHDLSATNVVDSNFAMLNCRLAEHYRLPSLDGSALRRVELPADSVRGGLMTQAAVLKVTANGTVTSPVRRGAWVMRKIVGLPPDPPPGDVPAIEPDVNGTTTIREMLAKHRDNPACAACHAKIDPPGFALESFDVIGGWQKRYRSLNEEGDPVDKSETWSGRRVGYTWGPHVDASGEMSDGRRFTDIEEFKKLLLADPRTIARNMVGQLVTYSTGAPIEFADRAQVERVLDRAADSQYGMRTLIHEMVQSPLFQTK